YLVVYPFVKLRSWYSLPAEDRQRAMDEHMRVGHEFRTIVNHTTYSFGIDDQEFMTAFECEEPSDFMHLMLTLRESEATRYPEPGCARREAHFGEETRELPHLMGGSANIWPKTTLSRRGLAGEPGVPRATSRRCAGRATFATWRKRRCRR